MLSDEDIDRSADEGEEEARKLEAALLAAAGASLLALRGLDARSVNMGAVGLLAKANSIVALAGGPIGKAVSRGVAGALLLHAITEAERIAGPAAAARRAEEGIDVAAVAAAALADVRAIQRNMAESCKDAYYRAVAQARRDVATMGHDRAMARAVADMAREGLAAYAYQRRRKGGGTTTVRVPVDVGVRRAIVSSGLQAMMAEELEAAARYGRDLVEVNVTVNARPSHAAWQGQVYSISGNNPRYPKFSDACRVGDPVNGIGGYNCGHRIAATVEGAATAFRDPLEGTGCTAEEARAAVSKQRRLENEVRKAKRERDALRANGLDASDAARRVRMQQKKLAEHVEAHPRILHRQRSRESIYEQAVEKKREFAA